mmetsp:Transcript_12422/g.35550  ORF Transcript_12422/g.35550 Transcript_12422/m.35550 type:complete len:232 (+) Transcript_12422:873-1568(+)
MSSAIASSSLYVRAASKTGPLVPKLNSTKLSLLTFEFFTSCRASTKISCAILASSFGVRESTKYWRAISPGCPIAALYIDASSLMACTPSTAAFFVSVSCSLRTCHASRHFHRFRSSRSSKETKVSRAICRPAVNTFQTLPDTTLNMSHARRMFSFPMATNAVPMERAVEKKTPPRMKAISKWNACATPANFTLTAEADIVDAAAAPGNIGKGVSLLEEKGSGGVSAGRHG